MAGYFAGPTYILPDMSGRSDVIGKDCAMPTHIHLISGEYPGFRFLGLFPLSSSLPFPVITCVLDLQVCLDI